MARLIFNNIPYPEEQLEDDDRNVALGRFITAWSQIEGVCGFLFRYLSDSAPDVSQTIFDRVGTREQIDIVKALAESIPDAEASERLKTLMGRVDSLSQKRNKIAHAGWGTYNEEAARYWHGLTSANFVDIMKETQKGQALKDKNIHTVSELTALVAASVALREELITELSAIKRRYMAQHLRTLPQRFHAQFPPEHPAEPDRGDVLRDPA